MTEQLPSPDGALDRALADAAESFAHWRATRRRAREHTPPALRERAVALLAERRVSHVARTLGLNPATLARWASVTETDTVVADHAPPDAFVPLPPTAMASEIPLLEDRRAAPSANAVPPELIVRWANGTQLIVHGALSPETLGVILTAAAGHSASEAP